VSSVIVGDGGRGGRVRRLSVNKQGGLVMKISRKIKDKVAVLKDGELVALLMCVSPAWRSLRYAVRAELARRKVWASRWGIKR